MHVQPSSLEVHEEKVHNNVYACARAETTRYRPQSVSPAGERGATNVMEEGVNTWDAAAQEYFLMKAVVITTVQDYLGLGYFSGQVVQGFCACVRCMDNTTYRQLDKDPGSSKLCSKGLKGGFPRNTHGENLDICSMGERS